MDSAVDAFGNLHFVYVTDDLSRSVRHGISQNGVIQMDKMDNVILFATDEVGSTPVGAQSFGASNVQIYVQADGNLRVHVDGDLDSAGDVSEADNYISQDGGQTWERAIGVFRWAV